MTTAIVSLLAKQSTSRLREMQAEVRAQLRSLEYEAELIANALAEKGQPPGSETNGAQPRVVSPRGKVRETFREIMDTKPDHVWLPAEIRTELAARGIQSTGAAIRVMLRRMAEADEVTRGPGGNGWKLASTNGSHQEPLVEATSWRSGGMAGDSPPAPTDGLG